MREKDAREQNISAVNVDAHDIEKLRLKKYLSRRTLNCQSFMLSITIIYLFKKNYHLKIMKILFFKILLKTTKNYFKALNITRIILLNPWM